MGARRYRQYLTAWIACFAVLVAALMPTVSRAMASEGGFKPAAAEVCSVNGPMAHHALGPQDDGALPDLAIHLDHCPFCLTHGGSVGLLPTAGVAIPIVLPAAFEPFLFLQGPRRLSAWTNARSRAPPLLS